MASQTPNMDLRKPTNNDTVNVVTDLSANFDKIDAHAHIGTYAQVGSNGGGSIDPYAQGARGDYTGRHGTTGTGTDNRAAIQAALTAASDMNDATYYGYLTRRSTTVKLAAGHYWISAPADGLPSLTVPAGVTFDCSDATLYCDYPAAPTLQWSAIKMEQYAQLHIGRLVNSGKVGAPDALNVYDGVRMVLTDNHSKVTGYKDSEINAFQGAGVRGIGAWITYVRGVRITGNRYGVVASHFGDGFTYTMPGKTLAELQNLRFATDLWIDDCIIVNCRNGGVRAGVGGDAADINAVEFLTYGGVVSLLNSTIENIATYAVSVSNARAFNIDSCHIEECGAGDGVLRIDTVGVATIKNLSYNLAGRTITKPDGTSGTAFPTDMLLLTNTKSLSLDGLYYHLGAAYNPAMRLANTTPTHYSVGGLYHDADPFAAGTIPSLDGNTAMSGGYASRHLVLNGTHVWDDGAGHLRFKTSAPASALDGALLDPSLTYFATQALASGEGPFPRELASGSVTMTSGRLKLSYFTALKNETVATASISCFGTAAGATPTLIRLGLYTVAGDGALTLVASTPSDTTLLATTFTRYTKAFSVAYAKVAGQRYAVAALVVTAAAAPAVYGNTALASVDAGLAPMIGARLDAQTDLPGSVAAGAVTAHNERPFVGLLP
jgi:hypothetical protein